MQRRYNTCSDRFEEFWASGPWLKLGKKMAARQFKVTVTDDEQWIAIQAARDHYAEHLAHNLWKTPQHGSTWMNNWLDWVEFVERRKEQIGIDAPGYYDGLQDLE